jgi:hypothetical protein
MRDPVSIRTCQNHVFSVYFATPAEIKYPDTGKPYCSSRPIHVSCDVGLPETSWQPSYWNSFQRTQLHQVCTLSHRTSYVLDPFLFTLKKPFL